jgi:hypothetical protein
MMPEWIVRPAQPADDNAWRQRGLWRRLRWALSRKR